MTQAGIDLSWLTTPIRTPLAPARMKTFLRSSRVVWETSSPRPGKTETPRRKMPSLSISPISSSSMMRSSALPSSCSGMGMLRPVTRPKAMVVAVRHIDHLADIGPPAAVVAAEMLIQQRDELAAGDRDHASDAGCLRFGGERSGFVHRAIFSAEGDWSVLWLGGVWCGGGSDPVGSAR
jgi:hypothetical protein